MSSNDVRKHKRININIGMIIFFIILIYIVISVFIYLGKEKISVVDVQKGKIVDNGYYTGIILRSEEVVASTNSGTINFYVHNGGKVAKNGNVYMLNTSATPTAGTAAANGTNDSGSSTGSDENTSADNNASSDSNTDDGAAAASAVDTASNLTSSDYAALKQIISVYTANYSDSRYSDLYTFKYDMQNQINEAISYHNISSAGNGSGGSYQSIRSDKSGIVSYTYDGLEGLTRDQITDDMFNSTNYEKKQLTSNQWISRGDPAYKLVTDDNWSIIIKLTPSQAKSLSEKKRVSVKFSKDNIETSARVEVFSNGESNYACLSLSKYMVRYISDRYIDIELIESSAEGLKIPTSAVLEKDFYTIPVEYLVTDSSTSEEGFYTYSYDDNGEMKATFYKAVIYDNDGESCYVDTEDFNLGDYIGKPDSSDRYRIGATGQLTGVYNINKGYSVFRLVKILYKNDEYCIVQANTPYGISLYDRIILNASSVNENQLIY